MAFPLTYHRITNSNFRYCSTRRSRSQYHLTDGIRVKEEINKDAAMGWPDERLELVGLKRQQSDTFFIEISKEDVPDNG